MQTFNVLLANSDRRVCNLIEALTRDVCGADAILNCTRMERIDQFTAEATREPFHLIIVAPQNILPVPGRWSRGVSVADVASAIRTIKGLRMVPVLAVAVDLEHDSDLSEAGVDAVLGLPFNCDDFKSAIRSMSCIPTPAPAMPQPEPSPSVGWKRALERLAGAFAPARSSLH